MLDSSGVPGWFRTGSEPVPFSGTGVPLFFDLKRRLCELEQRFTLYILVRSKKLDERWPRQNQLAA